MEKAVYKVSFENRSKLKTTSTLIYYAPKRRLSHSIPSIIMSSIIAQKTYKIFHLSLTLLYFHVASCFWLAWIAQDVPSHQHKNELYACMFDISVSVTPFHGILCTLARKRIALLTLLFVSRWHVQSLMASNKNDKLFRPFFSSCDRALLGWSFVSMFRLMFG